MSKEEKKFLKDYDSSKFEKLSITSDIVIFSVSDTPADNYRKLNTKGATLYIRRCKKRSKNANCFNFSFVID